MLSRSAVERRAPADVTQHHISCNPAIYLWRDMLEDDNKITYHTVCEDH